MNSFDRRRKTIKVKIGDKIVGGDSPILIQSMVTSATRDVEESIREGVVIAEAGGEMVRYTAASVAEASALREIRAGIRAAGYNVPLVADVHFNPKAAFTAAALIEKVRINPGNFVDARATFQHIEYTDSEYKEELTALEEKFVELIDICKSNNTALRIGVNHGSLSDRIMSRYGDTTSGMCESAMEFLRVCRRERFDNVVVSMKSSNVKVMVAAYRELVEVMDGEDMHYPLHLGVTEAGEGEDGRVKSAIGIGTLLTEGIGDTIRVSLTEPTTNEIIVASALTKYTDSLMANSSYSETPRNTPYTSISNGLFGGENTPRVIHLSDKICGADFNALEGDVIHLDNSTLEQNIERLRVGNATIVFSAPEGSIYRAEATMFFNKLRSLELTNPVVLSKRYDESSLLELTIKSSVDFGDSFLSGCGDGLLIENSNDTITPEQITSLCFSILQSTRARITRTEFISCPGCGRTMFALQEVTQRVKSELSHLKGMKIAIMGCNVNGPGEMADADFGYVGAGKDKIDLYRGKEVIKKGIDKSDAIKELIELIEQSQKK